MLTTEQSCAAIVMVLLDVWGGARYCLKLLRRQISPRIATWLIFEMGIVMSLAAYFATRNHSAVKAALNVTDGIVVTMILVSVFIEQRGRKLFFTKNEQFCLVISCITLIAWAITRTAWIGFVGFQIVMLVAYYPTLDSLWRWKPGSSPEPVGAWSIYATAAFIGVVIDVTGAHHDYVAMLYSLRAFILCVAIVVLVERWRRKNDRHQAVMPWGPPVRTNRYEVNPAVPECLIELENTIRRSKTNAGR